MAYIIYRTDRFVREYFQGYEVLTGYPFFSTKDSEAYSFEEYEYCHQELSNIRSMLGLYVDVNMKYRRERELD